jgi:hypothetical protein
MKKTLYMMALSAALSTVAFAGDWSGKLIDSTCNDTKEQTKVASCDANSATTSFALDVGGKIYKLDAMGNTKAATALKDRADRSADPAKPASGAVSAKVSGTEQNGVISVTTVEVQ